MDDKKKIVLGSEDFLAKGIDDIYINVNLQQTFSQIKKDKYDNNFDLAEQFRKERNESRSFRIYGIVDSNVIDTDNIQLRIYKDAGLTQYIGSVNTTPLVYEEQNVFAKKRGKYLIPLNNYDSSSIYIEIIGDNVTFNTQVFEQKLVFYDLEGNFVEYGTETVDIGLTNSGFLTIENDFPFFYNKHWIKRDIEIVETKPSKVGFTSPSTTVGEGDSFGLTVALDVPSPFGNESVTIDAVLGTAIPGDYSLTYNGNPVSFPQTITWAQGEQFKTFDFDAITDPVYEFSETLSFRLDNLNLVDSGTTIEHFVTIEDTTPRRYTNYHFGEIYKNRLEFSGRTAFSSGIPPSVTLRDAYSILRNGLKNERKNEAFYPGDTHQIIVTNLGITTILPENPAFGIGAEEIWPAGAFKTFNVDTLYDGSEFHKVKLVFPQGFGYNRGELRINGVRISFSTMMDLRFSEVKSLIVDGSSIDYITNQGYEKDWTAEVENSANTALTITSKCVGLPVDIDIIPKLYQISNGNVNLPVEPNATPYVEEIDPFVERNQVPKVLKLYANDGNNTQTNYQFSIQKPGYRSVAISNATHPASSTGVDRYLVSSFEKVARNWNGSQYMISGLGDDCIYNTLVMPMTGQSVITELGNGEPYLAPATNGGDGNYYWPVGIAYINGSLLLTANGGINSSRVNSTEYLDASFYPDPLLVIPCTNSPVPVNDVAQRVKMTIPLIGKGNEALRQLYVANAESFRSFDYRTGTTGPYTTVHKQNPSFFAGSGDFKWNTTATASGATVGSASLGTILNYGNNFIPSGPFFGLEIGDEHQLLSSESDNVFYLESKLPGIPFEITNIKDAYVTTTASNTYNQSVTAGDYSAGAPITVETIIPNAIAGQGVNLANNWMGGYNVDLVFDVGNGPQAPNNPTLLQPPALGPVII